MKKTYLIYLTILILALQGCTDNKLEELEVIASTTESTNESIDSNNDEIKYTYNMPNGIKLLEFNELNAYKSFGVFISENEGWKINSTGVGMSRCESILYKTDNGGITWNEIENNSLENKNSTIPIRGLPTIIFNDSNNGWMATNGAPFEGSIRLYQTTDGGFTWLFKDIDVSVKYTDSFIDANLPVFFSDDVGLLFLRARDYDGFGYLYFTYVTNDGGVTWNVIKENTVVNNIQWSILKHNDNKQEISTEYEVIYDGNRLQSSWLVGSYFTEAWQMN